MDGWPSSGWPSLMAFHVGQLAFGGVLWIWAPLMLLTLGLLLRAERHACTTERRPVRRPEETRATAPAVGAAALPFSERTGHVDRHP